MINIIYMHSKNKLTNDRGLTISTYWVAETPK